MGISTRVVKLDNAGNGTLHVAPGLFFGQKGATGVTNDGDDLGTALLTTGTARLVFGDVAVTGPANGEAVLYFQF